MLVLANSRDELLTAADQIRSVSPGLLLLAVALEAASYTAYAAGQRAVLVGAGGPPLGLPALTATAVLAQAAADCVPGGVAVTAVVSFRQFTRRGVPRVLAGWVLALSSGGYVAALAVLTLVAVQLAGASDALPGLRPLSLAVVAVLGALAVAALALVRRGGLAQLETRVRRRLARWRRRPLDTAPRWAQQLRETDTNGGVLVRLACLMLLSWTADVLVLVTAFHALGTSSPGSGLLLAYCAGQLAASVPVTPGGLGVVEGSLTLALVAFGGDAQGTLTAVLLYRLVSFWALLPAGALCWLALRRGSRVPQTETSGALAVAEAPQ